MLSFDIFQDLSALIASVERAAEASESRADSSEIALLVDDALSISDRLLSTLGADFAPRFAELHRHLRWLRYWNGKREPSRADGDVVSLRLRDLPEVVGAVGAWSAQMLDPKLADAVAELWRGRHYDAAVLTGFVLVEERIRLLAAVPPHNTLAGRKLVSRLLPTDGRTASKWSDQGFLGHLTDSQQTGARDLLNGALSLFRNASAHRKVGYSREEADEVLHLVSLCLRLLGKYEVADEAEPATEPSQGPI